MGGPYRETSPPLLSAARLVPPPVHARRVAAVLTAAFAVLLVIALVAPWQQTVPGTGRVIAYTPLERQQTVDSPVAGRIVRWFVQEGSVVREGDRIVEVSDNDPRLLERLGTEREALEDRLARYDEQVEAARERLAAVQRAQEQAVRAAEARLRIAQQDLRAADQSERAAEAGLDTARLNLARQRALYEQGLTSQRDLELAVLAETEARTRREAARARVDASRTDVSGKQADVERARAEASSNEASARSALQTSQADAANARATLTRMDVQIARQEAQLVTAPRAGTILRLLVNQGGEQVRAGQSLAILVPEALDRAVELWLDGNDAALVEPGRNVRLQFEGWPAVQFTGWPSVAVGTFGGRVAFIDSTDDGRGDFRMVVVPDPEDEPWPSSRFLRQGARANGWVLLRRVTVGFELWRQLNGFPPSLSTPPSTSTAGSAGSGSSSYGSSGGSGAGAGSGGH